MLTLLLALAGCGDPTGPGAAGAAPEPAALLIGTSAITWMEGAGTLGHGEARGDSIWLQELELSVGLEGGLPAGTFEFIDYSVFKEDGKPAHFIVGPDAEGTAILSFLQSSSACVDFAGTGYLVNTGEQLRFLARACDYGRPGVGLDEFTIRVPERLLTHRTLYQRGPIRLSDGELTATFSALGAL